MKFSSLLLALLVQAVFTTALEYFSNKLIRETSIDYRILAFRSCK